MGECSAILGDSELIVHLLDCIHDDVVANFSDDEEEEEEEEEDEGI